MPEFDEASYYNSEVSGININGKLDDELLYQRLFEALVFEGQLDMSRIHLDVTEGFVIVSGSVNEPAEKSRVDEILKVMDDVKGWQNNLAITIEP